MRRWLRPFAAYGAKASFSLYALHFPIIAFTAAWLLETERLLPSGANIALVIVTLAFTVYACGLFAAVTERHTARVRSIFYGKLSTAHEARADRTAT